MAEGLIRNLYNCYCRAYSAGTEPSKVNPYAIKVMHEIGIDISKHYSKSVDEFSGTNFDYVVTVCDNAKETCPFFPGKKIIHKGFKDPARYEGSVEETIANFRKTRDEIKDWIIKTFK